jgi:hypothetical protein
MTLRRARISIWLIVICFAATQQYSAVNAAPQANPLLHVDIKVGHIEKTKYGYLLNVEITNAGAKTLYFPQSSYWDANHSDPPKINGLGIEQWSDGKTNILSGGRTIDSTGEMKRGFFSVGPCRDDPRSDRWIVLEPGKIFEDQITAFEPPTGYITVMCRWRSAHLGGDSRIVLSGYLSRRTRKWIDFYSETFQLPTFNRD